MSNHIQKLSPRPRRLFPAPTRAHLNSHNSDRNREKTTTSRTHFGHLLFGHLPVPLRTSPSANPARCRRGYQKCPVLNPREMAFNASHFPQMKNLMLCAKKMPDSFPVGGSILRILLGKPHVLAEL